MNYICLFKDRYLVAFFGKGDALSVSIKGEKFVSC